MIKFTQFLRPDGRQKTIYAPCTPETQKLADEFIARGGNFEAEVLTTGQVSITACFSVKGEHQDIAIEICPNGPEIDTALDKLVLSAWKTTL